MTAWLDRRGVRRALRGLLAALLVAGTWLALTPRPPAAFDTGWDKANHAVAFAVLAIVALAAWPRRRWRDMVGAAALLLYGVVIEVAQTKVPGRDGDIYDVLADAVGIAAGIAVASRFRV